MAAEPARLAVLGDIHARHDALTAVVAAIRTAGIHDAVCTGDIVMRGPDPAACIATLQGLGWPTVAGNTDRKVLAGSPRPPAHPASSRVGSRSWTYRTLGRRDRAWLRDLPPLIRMWFAGARVVLTHGDADSVPTAINAATPDRDVEQLLRKFNADVLLIGHTHVPMMRTVRNGLVLNPGAVGESRDPDWKPRWAWLERVPKGIVAHLEVIETPLAPQRDDAPED